HDHSEWLQGLTVARDSIRAPGGSQPGQVRARCVIARRSHPLVRLLESAGPRRGANASREKRAWPVVPAGRPPLSWGRASSAAATRRGAICAREVESSRPRRGALKLGGTTGSNGWPARACARGGLFVWARIGRAGSPIGHTLPPPKAASGQVRRAAMSDSLWLGVWHEPRAKGACDHG